MPTPNTSLLQKDAIGLPIPQEWSPDSQAFQALLGQGGASSVLRGSFFLTTGTPTTTTLPLTSLSGLTLALSTKMQSQWAGATAAIVIGTTLCQAVVQSVTSAGVITLDSALPAAPGAGAYVCITPPDPSVQTGSLPEPRLGAWTTIYTVTAANMPAGGGSNYPSVESVLTPGATKRYFDISNSLNQAWTLTMFVCDSTGLGGENYPGNSAPSAINIATNEAHVFLDSDSYPQLRSLGDSLKLTITSGATQATTGQFSIDVREAFN